MPRCVMACQLIIHSTADVAHTAALAAAIYQYTIAQFGNWPGLQRMTATTQASIVLGGAVCFAVQARRTAVARLSR